jgi:hypothetical protein
MIRGLVLLFALSLGVAHAEDARTDAIVGAAADCLTTGAALTLGAGALTEGNPIGAIASCAIKPIAVSIADQQPEPARTTILHAHGAISGGAAANNLALMVAPKLGPWAAAIGVVTAAVLWKRGEREREYMAICAAQRSASPQLLCVYSEG